MLAQHHHHRRRHRRRRHQLCRQVNLIQTTLALMQLLIPTRVCAPLGLPVNQLALQMGSPVRQRIIWLLQSLVSCF